jgi:hypothetical protein
LKKGLFPPSPVSKPNAFARATKAVNFHRRAGMQSHGVIADVNHLFRDANTENAHRNAPLARNGFVESLRVNVNAPANTRRTSQTDHGSFFSPSAASADTL